MAAAVADAGEFESWLNERLDTLEADREVYGSYILGVLQEEESDEDKWDALQGILSAFLGDDTLEEVCKQIINQWADCCSRSANKRDAGDVEVQAIASMMEKQAQIVVRQKEVTEESKKRKEALLAQYANVTDGEDEGEDEESPKAIAGQEKSMFKNTNAVEVLNRQKQKRDQAREDSQKKKEMDKMQREKDKLAKQDRKEKEKKRTQKGERKR
ncbi:coiled-coil domain-containing protein 43 [Nerophis lumbriciformis]|uniref:coiled-coil domain-containing protein 43 n=1 Tax=Nerophis lumbriciformis TaxID=546530 RepID=UPI003BAC19DF